MKHHLTEEAIVGLPTLPSGRNHGGRALVVAG
jgi:hypothetical protein